MGYDNLRDVVLWRGNSDEEGVANGGVRTEVGI